MTTFSEVDLKWNESSFEKESVAPLHVGSDVMWKRSIYNFINNTGSQSVTKNKKVCMAKCKTSLNELKRVEVISKV